MPSTHITSKNRTLPNHAKTIAEVEIDTFLLPAPVKKSKTENISQGSRISKRKNKNSPKHFQPVNDDPFRLDTLNTKKLTYLVKMQTMKNEE